MSYTTFHPVRKGPGNEDQSYMKFRLKVEDVQRKNVLTNWLRSLASKWQTLIEAHNDVKTTENFTLRIFCIRFTK
ncbi:hypothetical protein C5167_007441 [Papaver somniferum]|nr:hypothetical protein C5167_007441 [Papaver somniferum]